ncbi:MAG: phosphatidylserine/phosphatidylglycerophosphate/cardiolipin synthase family protein [Caldimonas sp.]
MALAVGIVHLIRVRQGMVGALLVFATGFVILCILNLSLGDKQIDRPLARNYSVDDPAFERTVGAVLTRDLVGGNHIRTLLNGDEIFPAMLSSLRGARRSITFETYIFWSSTIGTEFEAAFTAAAKRGVQVKVLVDWIGGELVEERVERMREAGVEVRLYNAPRWNTLGRFNNRTHRKLMVVDGTVGFIGGAGIADDWRGNAQDAQHWRGTHFQVDGPVVAQLQSAFIDNWLKTTGEPLDSPAFLPALTSAGSLAAHTFASSPRGGSKSMQLLYLMSITAAARSIDLSAAYFVPDEVAVETLVAAARRGVRVRIIVPGPYMDQESVQHASRAVWEPLLAAGVQIYEFQPTMFHCKVMVVDGTWVTLGSSNFDARSFSINDEANLNVYDATFAAEQIAVFERDLTPAACRDIELVESALLDGAADRPCIRARGISTMTTVYVVLDRTSRRSRCLAPR